MITNAASTSADDLTTIEVARLLGMSVRSVQLMVDRGELDAWKTSGGHRRISLASVDRWRDSRRLAATTEAPLPRQQGVDEVGAQPSGGDKAQTRVLLIDDSTHFQRLVALLIRQRFPHLDLHVADDGIAGLALYGRLDPAVLIVDILLPGIDGAALITSLRSHPQFAKSRLVVVTSLDESERAPYGFALGQVPVVHKPNLVAGLSDLLTQWVPACQRDNAAVGANA